MNPHIIRLRDPWQSELASESGMLWSRAFHRPTGLTERETVLLVVSNMSAIVELNGQLLRAAVGSPAGQYVITGQLLALNQLTIQVPQPSDIRPFDVTLEILTVGQ